MATTNIDILMRIVDDGGQPLEGESQSLVSKEDDFTKEFVSPKFFDVEDFGLSMQLDDDDGSESDSSSGSGSGKKKDKKRGRFLRWLGGQRNLRTDGYPVEMQPFEFTRQLDWASPQLFQMCAQCTPLRQITLVQRKAGSQQTKEGINMCFLRIDFWDVLLIGLNWDVAESLIKEKITFISKKIQIQYKAQNETGQLYAPNTGVWQISR